MKSWSALFASAMASRVVMMPGREVWAITMTAAPAARMCPPKPVRCVVAHGALFEPSRHRGCAQLAWFGV